MHLLEATCAVLREWRTVTGRPKVHLSTCRQDDCEHVAFHRCLRETGATLAIYPRLAPKAAASPGGCCVDARAGGTFLGTANNKDMGPVLMFSDA